jgi:hypothetical protein
MNDASATPAASADALIAAIDRQVRWCRDGGSPFNAELLATLAADWRAGGPMHALLPDWPHGDPLADVVALRLTGAFHALAISGRSRELAALYPPQVSCFDADAMPPLLRRLLVDEAEFLRGFLQSPPQTNEVMRCAALIGGYAAIARRTGRPLAICEIGASAGLNLLWDRFHYRCGATRWGDPASPVLIDADWRGNPPDLPARIEVASRCGNDRAPVDPTSPDGALRLRAYLWPDQLARAQRLDGAIALARATPPPVVAEDAADFVAREFAAPVAGETRVLVHSIVWQYLPAATRERITATMERAAALASADAPIAWLRFEWDAPSGLAELRLTIWPDGTEQLLARAHPHGNFVDWQ